MQKQWFVVDNPEINIYFSVLDEENKTAKINSALFQCGEFLKFINGTSAWDGKNMHKVDGWIYPTEMKLNRWETVDDHYHWKLVCQENFTGINWTYVNHSSQGENECWGLANFSYEHLETTPMCEETIVVPNNVRYPRIDLQKIILERKQNEKINSRICE